jgi:hypothetical protein
MEVNMKLKKTTISIPELGLLAVTRALAGAGLGLILSDYIAHPQRKAIGWTLFLVGAASTIPLGFEIFGNRVASEQIPSDRNL